MKHIKVFRDASGQFGFSSPYVFQTLRVLVENYSQESLEKHNPDLPTKLAYPIGHKTLSDHGYAKFQA